VVFAAQADPARALAAGPGVRAPARPAASFGLAVAQTAEAQDAFRYTTPWAMRDGNDCLA
jgi:hypothetical protein